MANELTKTETGALVSALDQQGIGEILKPLIREIHLFDSNVAGTSYLEDKSVLDEISEGDKLTLQREDNKFDSNAILILAESGKKLGYVPERDNLVFARLMDAGKLLTAKIKKIEYKGSFSLIRIKIYLIDF